MADNCLWQDVNGGKMVPKRRALEPLEPPRPIVRELLASLDPAARENFTVLDQHSLCRSMDACGMQAYPPVTGDPDGVRVSGQMVCNTCGQTYYNHPLDWRVIEYGDRPFLHVLCDGRRVKL